MSDKIIVSHDGALKAKYGDSGLRKIRQSVANLIKEDAKRGLATAYVSLDDTKAMKGFGAKAITRFTDMKAWKQAIDALCATLAPDYLMLLGSFDVIPHQKLKNPVYDRRDPDPDEQWTFSDLPYACAAPGSEDPSRFIAPSRVVGRLPDQTGAKKPDYLLKLLGMAIHPTQIRKASITPFGISTRTWLGSTNKSLAKLFGPGTKANTSPLSGPQWSASELASEMHFINCHGGQFSPLFAGEPGEVIAHDASWIDGKIKSGTVAAVECCFGAELYDPKKAGGRLGIGQTYMACGSTAYVGSTNSAYGPEKGNDNADLICRYFLEEVLNGRSSGDAFLTARLRYVKSAPPPFDAIDLKTLSQFILLGDPSIHPVLLAGPAAPKRTAMHGTAIRNPSADGFPAFRLARKGRRRKAATQARVLAATAPVGSVPIGPPAAPIAKILREALEKAGTGGPRILTRSFGTVIGAGPDRKKAKGKGSDIRVHIAKAPAAKPKVLRKGSLLASHAPKPPVVVIREIDGKVLDLKTLYVKSTPDSPGHRC